MRLKAVGLCAPESTGPREGSCLAISAALPQAPCPVRTEGPRLGARKQEDLRKQGLGIALR